MTPSTLKSTSVDTPAQLPGFGTPTRRLSSSPSPGRIRSPATTEAVLVVNASGTVDQAAMPAGLVELPRIVLAPAGRVTPGQSTFENAATLKSFMAALHRLFERLELPHSRAVQRLHVLAAVPVSAAVQIGKSLPVNNAAPRLVLYHLDEGSYVHAFDIPRTGELR